MDGKFWLSQMLYILLNDRFNSQNNMNVISQSWCCLQKKWLHLNCLGNINTYYKEKGKQGIIFFSGQSLWTASFRQPMICISFSIYHNHYKKIYKDRVGSKLYNILNKILSFLNRQFSIRSRINLKLYTPNNLNHPRVQF